MLWRKDSTHKYIRIKCSNTIIIDNSSYHTNDHYVTKLIAIITTITITIIKNSATRPQFTGHPSVKLFLQAKVYSASEQNHSGWGAALAHVEHELRSAHSSGAVTLVKQTVW